VSEKWIKVEYTPSKDMLADGFTKVLQNNAFRVFIQQIGLVDITEKLNFQELPELIPEINAENSDSDD
jgi:hypothetical protein